MPDQKWRTYTGAEYDDVRTIPCIVIANGYLIDATGEPLDDRDPAIGAEIVRRGSVYIDHGYGLWDETRTRLVPTVGCDHSASAVSR